MSIIWFSWRDIKNPDAGGAEIVTHYLCQDLVKKNHQVTIISSRFKGCAYQETIDGIVTYHPRWFVTPKIFRALYGFFFFFSILPKVLDIKKTFLFDVIDGQWVYPDGFAATLLARLVRKPVVVHALGCDINLYTRFFLRRKLIVWCLKKANGIVAVSNVLKDKIVSLGIAPEKVQVIANGINQDSFRPMSRQECRNKLALPLDKNIVLFIG